MSEKKQEKNLKNLSIYEKLCSIQTEMKAPKGQYNSFSKFNFRSAEDILEAVKPYLEKYGLALTIRDEIKLIGDRFYIMATAKLSDFLGKDIEVTGWAREALARKGMEESQITGSTSSYARKYALNGLFAIDDTKDADTNEYQRKQQNRPPQQQQRPPQQQGYNQQYQQQQYQQQQYQQQRQPAPNNNSATEKQVGMYHALVNKLEWGEDEQRAHLKSLGFKSIKDTNKQSISKVIEDLQGYIG